MRWWQMPMAREDAFPKSFFYQLVIHKSIVQFFENYHTRLHILIRAFTSLWVRRQGYTVSRSWSLFCICRSCLPCMTSYAFVCKNCQPSGIETFMKKPACKYSFPALSSSRAAGNLIISPRLYVPPRCRESDNLSATVRAAALPGIW